MRNGIDCTLIQKVGAFLKKIEVMMLNHINNKENCIFFLK